MLEVGVEFEYSLCFKALSDETRFKIVMMLKGGTMCACKILEKFNITQPTLSYHMKLLVDCRLVSVDKIGTWNHYTVNKDLLEKISKVLMGSFTNSCDCNCKML